MSREQAQYRLSKNNLKSTKKRELDVHMHMLLLKMYFDVLFGCGVFKAELRPAEVDPRFRKRETKIALSTKTLTL